MGTLVARPSLDELVEELRPLDVVWDDRRERAGLVVAWGLGDYALDDLGQLLEDVRTRAREGTPYVVLFLGDARPTAMTTASDGVLPRVRSPQQFRGAIAKIVEAVDEPRDRSPVRFDFHVVSRGEAPALWRLLAVFRDRGAELAAVDTVRTFLWSAYLSIVGVRDQRTLQSVRHHVAKASRAIVDMTMQTNPVLSLLGEAAAFDLEAAVVDRARIDGELVVEKLAAGLARSATEAGALRIRRTSSLAWMRVRNTFHDFPSALERVERELDAKYSTTAYRALT